MTSYGESLTQRRRLDIILIALAVFAVLLVARLFYLQILKHGQYQAQASNEHVRKYEIPARRGELYVHDGTDGTSPLALNQTLNVLYADPRYVVDKPGSAAKLAEITGASAAEYTLRLGKGIEYSVLGDKIPSLQAEQIKKLKLPGIGLAARDYRTYPEDSLAAQTVGFVNSDGIGQYGIEQYLNDQLAGKPGQLAGKTDTSGLPVYTAENVNKPPVDGKSYVLTIDRNVQAMVEQDLAAQVKKVNAKSGSAVVLDPNTGAVIAMATYPSFDPNAYSKVSDYNVFTNEVVTGQFEAGSGIKAFTMAAGLDQGKVTPDSTYDDPGCYKVDERQVCDAAGDKPGKGKTMTVVLRDSLNTGVMYVLRMLGGDPNSFTLAGKKTLYDYFTKHFGFGERTGIEQASEAAGVINTPSNAAGNNVNFANMAFGQGMSVTMIQMASAMAAIANGGKLYQPHLVDAQMMPDGSTKPVLPKLIRDHVISPQAALQLNGMLQVVAKHGSGYLADAMNPGYKIAGKTGTAQIPRPDGQGYIDGANIGSFVGFAPADNPKFVLMVRIDQPGVSGYAETTTVPVFGEICQWLFKYYGIAPTGQIQ